MSFRTSYVLFVVDVLLAGELTLISLDFEQICPWCYIAHLELNSALANVRAANLPVDFQVEYHPYTLHPGQAETLPVSKKESIGKKLGQARYEAMVVMVNERAKQFGAHL